MSYNFDFGMPNLNIQVPDFSPQDYGFDQGIGQFGQDAMTKRQQANEAKASASSQYEADVADFKDREATEAEDNLNNLINQGGIGGLQDWNWGGDVRGEPGFTSSDLGFQGNTGTATGTGPRGLYNPVDNWGEPGYEVYEPATEIIDPIEDFAVPEVSPFMDTNPFNDIWEAPTVNVLPTAGAGVGGDPTTDFIPVNNPFEPVVVDDYPGLDVLDPTNPILNIPGFGDIDDPGPIPTVDIPPYIPPYTPPYTPPYEEILEYEENGGGPPPYTPPYEERDYEENGPGGGGGTTAAAYLFRTNGRTHESFNRDAIRYVWRLPCRTVQTLRRAFRIYYGLFKPTY